MIWAGALMTTLGLCGIIYSIILVRRAKRDDLEDAVMRERLGKILPLNLAALFMSALGLMVVIVGIALA